MSLIDIWKEGLSNGLNFLLISDDQGTLFEHDKQKIILAAA
jgi:hypothetical protein